MEKIYFASDIHLGVPDHKSSLEREKRFCRWLDAIKTEATALYIVGDLFDFWFEYHTVIPKGYVRVLGKLAELTDNGVDVSFLVGNHDLWMFGYFEQELNIPVYHQSIIREIAGKRFFIAHGDGLGPGDTKYKWIKKYLFTNRLCQWLLNWIHPDFGVGLANYFSRRSRLANTIKPDEAYKEEQERLILYAEYKLQEQHCNYFIFGHQHCPLIKSIGKDSYFVNLGDWIKNFTYAIFDGKNMEIRRFEPANGDRAVVYTDRHEDPTT